MKKDLFAGHASLYAAFRPTYPQALFDHILQNVAGRKTAWDCATGNGQVAIALSKYFDKVYATDISQAQLDNAQHAANLAYSIASAEETTFNNSAFDLITVAQAFHWFNHEKFFKEAHRLLKPDGLLAIWGYGLLSIEKNIDDEIHYLYKNIVGTYWDKARSLVDEGYRQSHFPFTEISSPPFFITASWTLKHLAGYLESWSATQQYMKANHTNPVTPIIQRIGKRWRDDEEKQVSFPIFLRMGKFESIERERYKS